MLPPRIPATKKYMQPESSIKCTIIVSTRKNGNFRIGLYFVPWRLLIFLTISETARVM
ncbi:hypothetical protein YC2023_041569 [Brassica napus]